MTQYKIRPEYIDQFFGGSPDYENPVIDEDEMNRLSIEWEAPITELLEMVEKI